MSFFGAFQPAKIVYHYLPLMEHLKKAGSLRLNDFQFFAAGTSQTLLKGFLHIVCRSRMPTRSDHEILRRVVSFMPM